MMLIFYSVEFWLAHIYSVRSTGSSLVYIRKWLKCNFTNQHALYRDHPLFVYETHADNDAGIGYVEEYPTMHHFWIPRLTLSIIAHKILAESLWEFLFRLALWECSCYEFRSGANLLTFIFEVLINRMYIAVKGTHKKSLFNINRLTLCTMYFMFCCVAIWVVLQLHQLLRMGLDFFVATFRGSANTTDKANMGHKNFSIVNVDENYS